MDFDGKTVERVIDDFNKCKIGRVYINDPFRFGGTLSALLHPSINPFGKTAATAPSAAAYSPFSINS